MPEITAVGTPKKTVPSRQRAMPKEIDWAGLAFPIESASAINIPQRKLIKAIVITHNTAQVTPARTRRIKVRVCSLTIHLSREVLKNRRDVGSNKAERADRIQDDR